MANLISLEFAKAYKQVVSNKGAGEHPFVRYAGDYVLSRANYSFLMDCHRKIVS